MDEFNLIIGGTVQPQTSDAQFWIRIGSQAAITFLGISFAAWFGYRNARRVFDENKDDKAKRLLVALQMEMQENLTRIRPNQERFGSIMRSKRGEGDFGISKPANQFTNYVYQETLEFIGYYSADVGRSVVGFYTQLDRVRRLADELQENLRANHVKVAEIAERAYMQFVKLLEYYDVISASIDQKDIDDPEDASSLAEKEQLIAADLVNSMKNLNAALLHELEFIRNKNV